MTEIDAMEQRKLVWSGRPAVSVYFGIYGLVSIVLIAIFIPTELWLGDYSKLGNIVFPTRIQGTVSVRYPVELATAGLISAAYIVEVIRLTILRMRNYYALYEDGLYLDTGVVNLQNVYVSPMGFSDARLIRMWSLRIAKRGNLVVDTNDQRHFELKLLEQPAVVQALIRRTLGRPTVRVAYSEESPTLTRVAGKN